MCGFARIGICKCSLDVHVDEDVDVDADVYVCLLQAYVHRTSGARLGLQRSGSGIRAHDVKAGGWTWRFCTPGNKKP